MDEPRSDEGIKIVIFDIDGTLYSSRSYEASLEDAIINIVGVKLGVSREEALRRLREAKRRRMTVSYSIEELGLDRHAFYRELARRVDPSLHISPRPALREGLSILRARGVKVAAHTNSGRELALKVLSSLGLEESDFDLLITSDEADPKPSPSGYSLILERLGCRPSEAVYVGDRPVVELRPAKLMGMRTIQVGGVPSPWMDLHAGDVDDALKILLRLLEGSAKE